MKFEDIINELGEFGPYQKRLYYMVCLIGIPTALQTLGSVFTMATPNHRCAIIPNDTYEIQSPWHQQLINRSVPRSDDEDEEFESCLLYHFNSTSSVYINKTYSCSRWVYEKDPFKSTFTADENMICDDKSLSTYANMIYMGGLLAGSLILGSLSDVIGRKKVLLIGIMGHFAVSLGIAFVKSYVAFVILRFCTAFFGIGMFLSAFVIGMEIVGPGKRTFAGLIIELFWCLGLFIEALLAYLIREWNYFQIATAIPTVFLLSYCVLMPESPRWLINRGRLEEAKKIIDKAAKVNKVTLSEKVSDLKNVDQEAEGDSVWQMFTTPVLLVRCLVIFFNWTVASLVYYGLSLNVGALSGDIYLNFTLSAIVEGLSYIFCLLLLDRFGRKPMQCFSMLLAGVACLGTMFPVMYGGDDVKWVTVTLSLVGKFGASAAFAIIYVYTAELFPTAMRNSGMGLSSFSARIGGVIAPYIADLSKVVSGRMGVALPLIIFGGVSLAAGISALILPETTNKVLPDSVEDARDFGKSEKQNSYALKPVADVGSSQPGKVNSAFTMDN